MKNQTWKKVKLSLVEETADYERPDKVTRACDVAKIVRSMVDDDPREYFIAIYLDAKLRPVATHVVSIGTHNTALVQPAQVFGPALMLSAHALVVAHNHPSGDTSPSESDKSLTERLRRGGKILGIEVLDHVIVGHNDFYSFAEEG